MYKVGVEIETIGLSYQCILNDHLWRTQYGHYGFGAKHDGSLSEEGCEFTTPPLEFPHRLYRLGSLYSYINNSQGIHVDYSCGLHVHVSNGGRWTAETIRELEKLCLTYQEALYLIGRGDFTRHRGTQYCQSLRGVEGAGRKKHRNTVRDKREIITHQKRYQVVNFQNVDACFNTIEFRFFNATLNPLLATAYCHLAVGLCEKAAQAKCRKISRKLSRASCTTEKKRQAARLLKELPIDPWARAILVERAKS